MVVPGAADLSAALHTQRGPGGAPRLPHALQGTLLWHGAVLCSMLRATPLCSTLELCFLARV